MTRSQAQENDRNGEPTWDCTQITMRAWLRALPDYLDRTNSSLHALWSEGIVISRNNVTCAPTDRHTLAIRDDIVRSHSFEKPITYKIFDDVPMPLIPSS